MTAPCSCRFGQLPWQLHTTGQWGSYLPELCSCHCGRMHGTSAARPHESYVLGDESNGWLLMQWHHPYMFNFACMCSCTAIRPCLQGKASCHSSAIAVQAQAHDWQRSSPVNAVISATRPAHEPCHRRRLLHSCSSQWKQLP